MLSKVRMIFILLLTLVLATSLAAISVTGARYVSYPSPSNESTLTGDSDYSLSYQLRIYNVDQLIAAIANGYSNIIIDESVANPLFVSGEEMEVTSNLILDLNGHEIQRNDRDPMLNVTAGVQLTIIDSSTGQNGSLYNPVGSVLNIDGGVLTTLAGNYESGPRKNEYLSNYSAANCVNSGLTGEGTYKGGVIYDGETIGNITNGTSTMTCPVILPQVVEGATVVGGVTTKSATVNGSIYIDSAYTTNNCNVAADTYLYFVMEGAESRYVSTEGAQYSYSYYVKASDDLTTAGAGHYTYVGTTSTSEDDILVTVYAYENDKYIASDASNSLNTSILGREISNFAAIKMQRGSLNVQGGSYYSYFGEATSYCVSATGGSLSVYNGRFEALEEGVCVRSAADTAGGSTGSVAIYAGEFYSYKGDMAQVENGTVTVTGGAFTKDASAYTATTEGENNSAIDLKGGTMTVSGATFNLNGSYVNGIKCQNDEDYGVVTVSDTTITYNGGSSSANTAGSYNVGIANYGGTINVTDCLFDTKDSNSTGIKSEADSGGGTGAVTANGCYFVLSGGASKGIKADAGEVNIGDADDVSNTICMFYIDHVADCYGIYAKTASDVTLNVNAAQFIMGQGYYGSETTAPNAYSSSNQGTTVFNSAGIYLDATADSSINLKRAVFIMAGSYSAGVYAAEGAVTQTDTGASGYTSALLIGVTSEYYDGNGLNSQNTANSHYETKFNNNYYVALYGSNTGAAYAAAAAATYYTSGSALNTISNQFAGLSATNTKGSYGIFSEGGDITAANVYVTLCSTYGAGIYSSGGNITISDFQCDVRSTEGTPNTAYPGATATADVSSAAIASNGGAIAITSSAINTDAYGFKVDGGSLTFIGGTASNETEHTLYSLRATATYVDGGSVTIAEYATFTLNSNIATQAGWTDPSGDLLTDYKNLTAGATSNTDTIKPDGIYVTGGSFTSNGTLNITFSGLNNDYSVSDYTQFNITSYAIRIEAPSGTTDDIEVTVTSGEITSSIGGGVLVSKDSSVTADAKVTLGVEGAENSALSVTTTGTGGYSTKSTYAADGTTYTFSGNWQYRLYQQCGHAIKVDNGDVTIYNGIYNAKQGNGIYVVGSGSEVVIKDGIFLGQDQVSGGIGPGISYAVKLFDGQLTIYDGQFGYYTVNNVTTRSNCVFIFSETENSNDGDEETDYSCRGFFLDGDYDSDTSGSSTRAITVIGYCYTQIGGTDSSYNPTFKGEIYAIGLESMSNAVSNSKTSLFRMYSGTVNASYQDGIWIGNANCIIDIEGGTIYGYRYGIYFAEKTDSNVTVAGASVSCTSTNGIHFSGATSGVITIGSETANVATSISGVIGAYFNGAVSGTVNIGSTTSSATTTISGTSYGVRFASTISGNVNINGALDGDSNYTTSITGSSCGVLFNSGVAAPLAITTASIYGGSYGLDLGSASSANITITGSKVYSGNYGLYFYSNVFSSDSLEFTVDSSTVYGAVGIMFSAATGTYGTFTIKGGSVVYGNTTYQGMQFNNVVGMPFEITGAGTQVYGGARALQFGSNATLTGSIEVTDGAKLYTTTSSSNGVINYQASTGFSGSITVENSTIEGVGHGIYIGSASTGNISISGSTITADNQNGLYFAGEMSGALSVASSSIESYYNAIHFADASSGTVTINGGTITSSNAYGINFGGAVSEAVTITGGTITSESSHAIYFDDAVTALLTIGESGTTTTISASLRGIHFDSAPTAGVTLTGVSMTANNGIYLADQSGIASNVTITGSDFTCYQSGVYVSGAFSASGHYGTLTIDSTTITIKEKSGTTSWGAIYFVLNTNSLSNVVIQNGSTLKNEAGCGIYAAANFNIVVTMTDSNSTIEGSTYAVYVVGTYNTSARIELYSSSQLISANGNYLIYAGTNSSSYGVTCSNGDTVTVNETRYTG